MHLDSVLLEVMRAKVEAAAEEMSSTLQRTARTLYVKEAADFATALTDLNGRFFAYPPTAGVTIFIDNDCGPTIRSMPDLEEGDVIVTNDVYRSQGLSTHLPDIHMIRPYFWKGKLVCYGWCFIHSTDVGGRVPSSISPSNHEIFQEGLIIPPMKIVKKSRINDDFVKVFTANCRTPDANMGDIKAMLGSLHTGQERVNDIIARHGLGVFMTCQEDLQTYSEAKARAVISRVPDGDYEFWDYMDDDLVSNIPVRIRVKMTVKRGGIHLDFTGTDPQVAAAYNIPTFGVRHHWLTMRFITFICTHDRSMAINAGLYRPITVTNPKGSVLNAEFPDAVGIRHSSARRLSDALTGSILKAAPNMMAAPTCGATSPTVLAENDPKTGKRNVLVVEPLRGGMGACKGQDGVDARDATMSNMKNHPVEFVEADAGIVIREYDICADTGGPGEWRGGTSQMLTFEVLNDGGEVLSRGMDRFRFPPWGVAGGTPAKTFHCILNKGKANEKRLSRIDVLTVNRGDTVTLMLPGASGFGDPFARPPEKVLEDVEQGFVTRPAAASDYGVVITKDGAVDVEKTKRLRLSRVRDNLRADFDFGPEREAWEAVFDDETMCEINRRLSAMPKSVRHDRRRHIFESAVPNIPAAGLGLLTDVLRDPDTVRARLRQAMDELLI